MHDSHRLAIDFQRRITPMFAKYIAELVARLVLLSIAVFLLFTDPSLLDISTRFSLSHGITFVDIAFAVMILDMATKLFPSARIAIGSKKQYGTFHKPTPVTVEEQVRDTVKFMAVGKGIEVGENLPVRTDWLGPLPEPTASSISSLFKKHVTIPAEETAKGISELSRQVARQLSSISGKNIASELLDAGEEMRSSIRENRVAEIVPVVVFWMLLNALVAMILLYFGTLSPQACLLWSLLYFVADMVCVVAWCPFQVILMRNRCCTTCQIFNWDAIMAVTPLLFVPCPFSWLLLVVALIVLVRWEAAFLRNPERFDERTNASLSCSNCTDKLCVLRRPLKDKKKRDSR